MFQIKGVIVNLCIVCFKQYKQSKEGKTQRKLKLKGLPNTYSKGNWPSNIYAEKGKRLCRTHRVEHNKIVTAGYQNRETNCKALGFMSYKAYLKSELWSSIRARKFGESGGICFKCGQHADAVHHSSYGLETLKGNDTSKLHAVCNGCHSEMEYFKNGDKAAIYQTMRRT